MKCEDCGKEDDTVHATVCPFTAEIRGKDIPVILCDECERGRAMEI